MVISVYALWDFHVSCACYSDYLSKRDHESFNHLYEFLNIDEKIVYGTFNKICEKYINKDGEIRDLTLKRILKDYPFENKKVDNVKKRVILIDEVDVFFGSDFFNMCYSPVAQI
jgi:preprotein translocase subunit SecA